MVERRPVRLASVPDPVALLFRHVLDERQRALAPPGARWLDVGAVPFGSVGAYDGACAAPGSLERTEPRTLEAWLSGVLRPGAPLLLAVTPSSADHLRRGLRSSFRWRSAFALGLLLPAPGGAGWAAESPQVFGLLAALERLLRRLPLLRGLGAFVVLEGVRR